MRWHVLIYVRGIALRCMLLSVGCSLAAGASSSRTGSGGSPAGSTARSASGHRSLSARDLETAKSVALRAAEQSARSITSATATRSPGTVRDFNTGHACMSGSVLHITLVGTFDIATGGHPVPDGSANADGFGVHDVLITADPETAQACFVSLLTGDVAPDPGATVLFTAWP